MILKIRERAQILRNDSKKLQKAKNSEKLSNFQEASLKRLSEALKKLKLEG